MPDEDVVLEEEEEEEEEEEMGVDEMFDVGGTGYEGPIEDWDPDDEDYDDD